ncbi:MAG: glycosyltransferase, partial [Nitrospinota bacterium]|nr:glycosyltransferase [Nitrospinota bacterium]
ESVLAQTYTNFELLVVDDGLSPETLAVPILADPRARVVKNRGAGLVDALNTGVDCAKGELVARMDADDICHPERFERQVDQMERRGLDIAATGVEVFGPNGRGEGYEIYERWINALVEPDHIAREIFIESPLPHPTVMMRTQALRKLGGYRDMGWPEDYDLWLRAMEAGYVMGKAPQTLLRWRDTHGRASRTDQRYSRRNFSRAKAHFLARTALKGKKAVIWGAGQTGGMLARYLEEEGCAIRAFIDISTRRIGKTKRGRPVFAPEEAGRVAKDELILGAVPARGARLLIREYLWSLGKTEGRDFFLAA